VTLDGAPLDGMQRKALARLRAYLPQNADCAWPISVASAVALGLTPEMPAVGGLAPADAARVAGALARADLADKADQAVTTLSGGERARAMLARAMVADPAILIADEPVAGLDPRHAIDCMGALRAHADRGRLVVVALHDLALAAQHADVVLALAGGRLVAAGAPEEVIAPDVLERLFGLPARVERDAAGASVRFSAPR
jgi:iron complex transport system ATP-binding protein